MTGSFTIIFRCGVGHVRCIFNDHYARRNNNAWDFMCNKFNYRLVTADKYAKSTLVLITGTLKQERVGVGFVLSTLAWLFPRLFTRAK